MKTLEPIETVLESAGSLADGIREGRVTSVQAVEEHLARIERHNDSLNAIVTVDAARALERAREADAAVGRGELWGPLHGVPFTVKDCFETAGLRTTGGLHQLADHVPERDATVVSRLRDAGAVLLGKTNVVHPKCLFGGSRNPWNPARTAGTSSGGSAAAVAAGLTPLCVGSDDGGSLRVPAHYCGVPAFMPTDHSVSTAGYVTRAPASVPRRHLRCAGPLARTVSDLRLVYEIIAGPDPRQPWIAGIRPRRARGRGIEDYRVAWTHGFGGVAVDGETHAAQARFVDRLRSSGCKVEAAEPRGFDPTAILRAYGLIGGFEAEFPWASQWTRRGAGYLARVTPGRLPLLRASFEGHSRRPGFYDEGLGLRERAIATLDRFFLEWDGWLCPVAPTEAPPPATYRKNRPKKLTIVFNATGSPVVVLPMGRSAGGLPIGVQLVGRRWGDLDLLDLAERILAVTGGPARPPLA